jgi:transposase
MFIRQKKNKSGSISISIIDKTSGKYTVRKTIGSSDDKEEIELMKIKAKQYLENINPQAKLFHSEQDQIIVSYLSSIANSQIRTVGPELVFGKIYDYIGYNDIQEEMFRHLVIARLTYPGSKLKTIDYLERYQGKYLEISGVYRFLDMLNDKLKETVERISFKHTSKRLNNNVSVVFYDMTTLYFESSDEDDLRKTGFSKDGKHSNPQIFLGLLVGMDGWPIGYEIYEGNIYEGHTLIPSIQKYEQKYSLNKPIIIADSGLLSKKNISLLEEYGYEYILGARIKSESKEIKQEILSQNIEDGKYITIEKENNKKLIVSYSDARSKKDLYNRERGLKRLEKQLKAGRLTKSNINNRGYNKYLHLEGKIQTSINYEKFEDDSRWDGLKGYITNCDLSPEKVIENYKCLWQIEKAFRISKTDLRIRPIYHRLRSRIEAHICISFVGYSIIKELETMLAKEDIDMSINRAAYLTHNIYEIEALLPETKVIKRFLLKMDDEQGRLIHIVDKYCRVSH